MAEATSSPTLTAADHQRAMADYSRAGVARAMALGNRGPIRFTNEGKLDPAILDSYWTHGFYVFEGTVGPEELQELRAAVDGVLARAPVAPGAAVDRSGRPALGEGILKPPYRIARPLSDPVGGTDKNNGRHPAQMLQPTLGEGGPAWTVDCHHHHLRRELAVRESYNFGWAPLVTACWVASLSMCR